MKIVITTKYHIEDIGEESVTTAITSGYVNGTGNSFAALEVYESLQKVFDMHEEKMGAIERKLLK